MKLLNYSNEDFQRGCSIFTEFIWIIVNALFVSSWLPGSMHRRFLLRIFGANIGRGVCIKPGVYVKFPWRLSIGDYSWIGENVWIDNLDQVDIGSDCCLSQGAYLCTGSHDWGRETFDLITSPIKISDQVWICAQSRVAPGVEIGQGAILAFASVAMKNLDPWTIYHGNPSKAVRSRVRSQKKFSHVHSA